MEIQLTQIASALERIATCLEAQNREKQEQKQNERYKQLIDEQATLKCLQQKCEEISNSFTSKC